LDARAASGLCALSGADQAVCAVGLLIFAEKKERLKTALEQVRGYGLRYLAMSKPIVV
jgi:hypothetical protein